MNKVIICLTGLFFLSLGALKAQDNTTPAQDTARQVADSIRQAPAADTGRTHRDTATSTPVLPDTTQAQTPAKDTSVATTPAKDTSVAATPAKDGGTIAKNDSAPALPDTAQTQTPAKDNTAAADSTAKTPDDSKSSDDAKSSETTGNKMDTRWFISPLLKFQFQDFALLEKNRLGYLSDANTLSFDKRGNASFAASAYKNIIGGLSISADLGLSFGHVTNDNVLISQTRSKTYNLLGAALYYNLLSPAYHLQPYVTIGINDVINDASYVSAPMGIGAKYTGKKIMVMGQIAYGYAVNKNISNTTMYSLGVYLPIKNKKQKQQEKEDNSPYNRPGKDDDKKKDTTSGKGGGVVNNIYITINMDSVMKAKGLSNDDGSGSGKGRKGSGSDDGEDDGSDGSGSGSHGGKHHRSLRKTLNLDEDFSPDDYKVDTINGLPVVRFVVYFEFNEYSLNSKAFSTIDKVLAHLESKPDLTLEIKGYTDDIGSNSYNNFLSRRRAKMVLEYMNSRGVPSDYMKAKAYGSDNPVADNKDPNQAWLNRRAEIIVHEK